MCFKKRQKISGKGVSEQSNVWLVEEKEWNRNLTAFFALKLARRLNSGFSPQQGGRTRGRTWDSGETEQRLQNPRIQDCIVLNCLACYPTWEAPLTKEQHNWHRQYIYIHINLITTDLQTMFSCRSSWLTQKGGLSNLANQIYKSKTGS